jgi:RNA polymerase sigma-B factor
VSSSSARSVLHSATGLQLAKADLRELFRRWQLAHDEAARDQLFERFRPLARKLARRYTGAHEPFEDLFQVASLGLLKAIDRFDPDRGFAFTSFAVPTIVGELKRHFRDAAWSVHVPRALKERALKIESEQERLALATGRSPTVPELAQALELSIEEVVEGLEAGAAHHSKPLDAPRAEGEDEDATLRDTFGMEDDGYRLVDHRATVASAIHALAPRERQILGLRFFADRTQSEIGDELGVSQMQISRILRRTLTHLNELTDEDA